jgi:hypothetical protein
VSRSPSCWTFTGNVRVIRVYNIATSAIVINQSLVLQPYNRHVGASKQASEQSPETSILARTHYDNAYACKDMSIPVLSYIFRRRNKDRTFHVSYATPLDCRVIGFHAIVSTHAHASSPPPHSDSWSFMQAHTSVARLRRTLFCFGCMNRTCRVLRQRAKREI